MDLSERKKSALRMEKQTTPVNMIRFEISTEKVEEPCQSNQILNTETNHYVSGDSIEVIDMRASKWTKVRRQKVSLEEMYSYVFIPEHLNKMQLGPWEMHRLRQYDGWEKISAPAETRAMVQR